ncbi:MAG: hypothetical protein ACKKL5_02205 [Candidatus Komeilibacteria bacterium]
MLKRLTLISVLLFAVMAMILYLSPVVLANTTSETLSLQKQLEAIQQEIDQYQQQLNTVKYQKSTLSQKIYELTLQQNKLTLQIQQSQLNIEQIDNKLNQLQTNIAERNLRIQELADNMTKLLRELQRKYRYSGLEIWLMNKDVGGFFNQISAYSKLTSSLAVTVEQVKQEKDMMLNEQNLLSESKEQQGNLLAIADLQNQKLSGTISERNKLLVETKEQEDNYQAILSDKQKQANEIKNRIYDLLGVSRAVTFNEAVQIAEWAEDSTGVRAAFLLAILTQESNLGKNVGTCNRPGDPPEKSWKVIMKPSRDQEPFKQITAELGMDPDVTPVSCPMRDKNGEQIGWGGAMGPAQFIPSTWIGYKDKVSAITGKPANPWDIRDAFLAAAILSKANGAGSQDGEWAAAMRYFSGSTNPAYRFYGDNVVALADQYQQDIDKIK